MPNAKTRDKAIVLITFNRAECLSLTLDSLIQATSFIDHSIYVVHQLGDTKIKSLLDSKLREFVYLPTAYPDSTSTKEKINRNMFLGLSSAFDAANIKHVVIVEEDICVAPDFLDFCETIINQEQRNDKFRAVSGFSSINPSRFDRLQQNAYVKLNYGVGWGWAISRGEFDALRRIWNGTEDAHWDAIAEVYFRTGYVVNPVLSRTVNIGFGTGASHTTSKNDMLPELMMRSFLPNLCNCKDLARSYFASRSFFSWRKDCINLSQIFYLKKKFLFLITKISYLNYRVGTLKCFKETSLVRRIINFNLRFSRQVLIRFFGEYGREI